MGEGVKWYRVVDPLNPLYGCDVRCIIEPDMDTTGYSTINAMRRVDIFVGDRPFQLIAQPGKDLGLMVFRDHLEESPVQDEIVELGTDYPYGKCQGEMNLTRGDDLAVNVAKYESTNQVALLKGGKLLKSVMLGFVRADNLAEMFEDGRSVDDILEYMAVYGGEEDQ